MKNSLVVLSLGIALVGCAPSINQQTKAHVDTWRAKLAAADTSFSEQPFTMAGWKLVPGAWAQYLVTQEGQGPAQITYKVLEAEGDDVWLEIERWDYSSHAVMKLLVSSVTQLTDAESFKPKRIISQQDDEAAQEMPPFLLEMMAKPMVGAVRIDWEETGSTESLAVLAGRFAGAKRVHVKTESAFGTHETDSWGHGAVPMTGLVKSTSSDGKYTMELVAFGASGAVSALVGSPTPMAGF